jgi:hypothetical protein
MAADAFRRIAYKEEQLNNSLHLELCDIISNLSIDKFDSTNMQGDVHKRQKMYKETITDIFYNFYNRSKI